MHSLCCTLMDFDNFFNILTTTLLLYIATICKPVWFTTSSIYCLTSNKKIYVTFSLDKIEENGILHKNLKTPKEFTFFLLYFIISTLLLDLKTMWLTRFILIFIKLFWVLKLLYGFSQIQKHTYLLGLKRYTAVSVLFDSFCSVRSSICFPYFRFGPFLFVATLMQEVSKLR